MAWAGTAKAADASLFDTASEPQAAASFETVDHTVFLSVISEPVAKAWDGLPDPAPVSQAPGVEEFVSCHGGSCSASGGPIRTIVAARPVRTFFANRQPVRRGFGAIRNLFARLFGRA